MTQARARRASVVTLPVLALVIIATGCATSTKQGVDGDAAYSDIRRIQADQTTLIATIRNEIREINGRLDVLQHDVSGNDTTNQQITDILKRIPPPQGVPANELEAAERLADESRDQLFIESLASIRSGKFGAAAETIDRAISQNGKKAIYLFWLGLANEFYGRLEKALGAYHECASSYSTDDLAPAALSRQAEAFIKLSDKGSAKLTFQKLITSYPKSTYAQNAKGRLKLL